MNHSEIIKDTKRLFVEELGYTSSQFREEVRVTFDLNNGEIEEATFDLIISFHGQPKVIIEAVTEDDYPEALLKAKHWRLIAGAIAANADYFFITNQKNAACYSLKSLYSGTLKNKEHLKLTELLPNYKIKNWERKLFIENVVDDISVAHSRFFDYLYATHLENPALKFSLRKVNRANRLEKGYYFHGNETYCAISFWEGLDNYNKTPNIYIELENQNAFVLRLTCKDEERKIPLFDKIASLVGAYRGKVKGEFTNVWHKYYYQNDYGADYLDSLKVFLKKDKEIIDLVLQAAGADAFDIKPISDTEFNKSLDRVLAIREKRNQAETIQDDDLDVNTINYPIQLKKIRLEHIGSFKDLELDLSARVICILGENGLGKTSILRAISLSLVGVDNSSLIDEEHKGLTNLLQITGEEDGYPKRAKRGGITLEYEIEESYLNSIIFESIGPLEDNTVRLRDASLEEDSSFGILQDDAHFNQLIIGFSQVRGKKETRQKEEKQKSRPNLEDLLPLIYDEEDNRFDDLKLWLIDIHSGSKGDGKDSPEGLNKTEAYKIIITTIFDIISAVIGHKIELTGSDPVYNRLWVQEEDKGPVLFELLSQGFRNVFGWIGHFIKRLAESTDYSEHFLSEHAVVLIDEIDAYLHPKWQRNILNVLVKKFPNTQFIVTTHSPLVASYVDNYEEMILYKVVRNGVLIDATRLEKTYGLDNARILRSWMGLEDRTPVVGKKIDTLFELLEEEKLEEAKVLFNELKSYLGKDDETISQASTEIELLEDDLEE